MDAKELRDNWLYLTAGEISEASHTILRALDLLASVEGSGEEIVRDLGRTHMMLNNAGQHIHAENCERAAARIVADAQEKERLRAELASVNASLATERANGEREHGSRDQQITQLEVEIASVEGHADRLHYVLSWPPRRACND